MSLFRQLPRRFKRLLSVFIFLFTTLSVFRFWKTIKTGAPAGLYENERNGEVEIANCLKQYVTSGFVYQKLVQCAMNYNSMSITRNAGRFPVVLPVVFILLAHKRVAYLREVVNSLRRMDGIDNITLLVSHDGYFPEVEEIIASIDFCRVKKVYHPFSGSLSRQAAKLFLRSPQKIPESSVQIIESSATSGSQKTDPYLLKYNFTTAKSSFIADRHLTQTAPKHHYWWLWNFIFSSNVDIPGLGKSDTQVLTLEEDHILSSDALKFINFTLQQKTDHCPECLMSNIGNHENVYDGLFSYQKHLPRNIGILFGSDFFRWLQAHAAIFCSLNEYNWDVTLSHMAGNKSTRVVSLAVMYSRVKHIGVCGLHVKSSSCNATEIVNRFIEESEREIRKINYTSADLDVSVSEQVVIPEIGTYDGWSTGQIGNSNFWASSISKEHCMKVVKGFGVTTINE